MHDKHHLPKLFFPLAGRCSDRIATLTAIALLTAVGAARSNAANGAPRPAMKIVVEYEGANVDDMDEAVAPVMVSGLRHLNELSQITVISSRGKCETYLAARDGVPSAKLGDAIIRQLPEVLDHLPADAAITSFKLLPEFGGPPRPKIRDVPGVDVEIDAERAALLGVSRTAVEEAVRRRYAEFAPPDSPKALNALRKITIPNDAGQQVPLAQVAAIRLVKRPSHRVRNWP